MELNEKQALDENKMTLMRGSREKAMGPLMTQLDQNENEVHPPSVMASYRS